MGAKDFRAVADGADLDDCFERSRAAPVALFLHDEWCPVSTRAWDEMALVDGDVALVDVTAGRELTSAIETRTGVKHESPQVIVLRDARARWTASHGSITREAVREALAAR